LTPLFALRFCTSCAFQSGSTILKKVFPAILKKTFFLGPAVAFLREEIVITSAPLDNLSQETGLVIPEIWETKPISTRVAYLTGLEVGLSDRRGVVKG